MAGQVIHLLVMIGIYSILAYSMNLIVGFSGLLTFCHAAFYGVGAYTYALLTIGAGTASEAQPVLMASSWQFLPAMLAAGAGAGLAALGVGAVALRFRGNYFILSTLAFQMMVFLVLYNWTELARGAYGLYGIPRPTIFGWRIDQPEEYLLLVAGANALILPILFRLYRSPFGLSLKGLREDERAAEALGISAVRQHLSAFVVAGAAAGVAGGLFASYLTFIDPTSFGLRETIFLVTLLLLGGTGNIRGPIVGAATLLLLPEMLRFVGFSDAVAANVRELIFGVALIILMYWRPHGLLGEHSVR